MTLEQSTEGAAAAEDKGAVKAGAYYIEARLDAYAARPAAPLPEPVAELCDAAEAFAMKGEYMSQEYARLIRAIKAVRAAAQPAQEPANG